VISDVAHSVHQRLLNLARAQGRPFQELLQHYTLERFLYRWVQSPYADRFVLINGTRAFFVSRGG
jgi:hypothetical protein